MPECQFACDQKVGLQVGPRAAQIRGDACVAIRRHCWIQIPGPISNETGPSGLLNGRLMPMDTKLWLSTSCCDHTDGCCALPCFCS